jgi:hypothetical protein
MRFRLHVLLATLALCAALMAVPATGSAAIVGIGDQKASTFSDPLFKSLKVKRTRLITAYNSIFENPTRLDDWMKAARAARLEIVVAFNHDADDLCPGRCSLPSVRSYTRAIKAFRKKYKFVKIFQPWNEANSPTQPTGKNPKRAAQYYNALRSACRTCKITAADVLDLGLGTTGSKLRRAQSRFAKWMNTFKRNARGKPRLWGIHNYNDTNRRKTSATAFMLRHLPGEVWMTETGGVYSFTTQDGDQPLGPPSESRQARAVTHMYKIAARFRRQIKRIYIYQWSTNFVGDRFDAGLLRPDGTPRPAFDVVRRNRKFIK